MAMDEIVDGLSEVSCDVLVIGGGTAGPMAALKAICWIGFIRQPASPFA